MLHDRELTGQVYGYDPDGDTITAQVVSGPSHGTLTFNADGSFTYMPNTHYVGADSFTYTWSDGLTSGNTATVFVEVYAGGDAEDGGDAGVGSDSWHVYNAEGDYVSIYIGPLVDENGQELTYSVTGAPQGPTIVYLDGLDCLHGQPGAYFEGIISYDNVTRGEGSKVFTITFQTTSGDVVLGPLTWRINNKNRPPEGEAVFVAAGSQFRKTISDLFLDPDQDTLVIRRVIGPQYGEALWSGEHVSYSPPEGEPRSDQVVVLASDGEATSWAIIIVANGPLDENWPGEEFSYETTYFVGANTPPPGQFTQADEQLAKIVERVTAQMKREGWVSANPADDGAFGREFQKRVFAELEQLRERNGLFGGRVQRWYTDIWVRKDTLEVVAMGTVPQGIHHGELAQIDAIYVEAGYKPQVGQVLDRNKVLEVYELKTPDGYVLPRQLNTLKALFPQRHIKSVASPIRWDRSVGCLVANTKYVRAVKVFGIVASALGVAASLRAIIHLPDYDYEFHEIEIGFHALANADTEEDARVAAISLVGKIRSYLSHFVDSTSLDYITIGTVYRIAGK